MSGLEILEAWGITDPDMVGASEYRAIHDTLVDGLDGIEPDDDGGEQHADFALAMLDEFIGYAQRLKAEIQEKL